MQTFAYDTDKLRRRLAELGMQNQELAAMAGFSRATISNVLNGRTRNRKTFRKLASVLGLELTDLVITQPPIVEGAAQ